MVLFGGTDPASPYWRADTWEYDGATATWTPIATTGSPLIGGGPMAFDSARGRVMLFGGWVLNGDTWEYDGAKATWTQLANMGPSARFGHTMAYDTARSRIVLFGGQDAIYPALEDTWTYHTRGGPCACSGGAVACVNADCDTGYCIDGVCCEGASLASSSPPGCGTCQDCNTAQRPGVCATVANDLADPDSCAAPKICGAAGCGAPDGSACAFGAQCATGFCIQGVCCDTLCNGPCDVCAKSLGAAVDGTCLTPTSCTPSRPQGAACQLDTQCTTHHCVDGVCCDTACDSACVSCNLVSGTCMAARANTDPHSSCAGDPGCSGTCDGAGACKFAAAGTHCDVCKACGGSGRCDQLPADEDDAACGQVSCAALSTDCLAFSDVTSRRCSAPGLCAAPNDPAVCTTMTAAPDGQTCSQGSCRAGLCAAVMPPPARPSSGGCSLGGGGAVPVPAALVLLMLLAFMRLPRDAGGLRRELDQVAPVRLRARPR
jgi:hypothetical protein